MVTGEDVASYAPVKRVELSTSLDLKRRTTSLSLSALSWLTNFSRGVLKVCLKAGD